MSSPIDQRPEEVVTNPPTNSIRNATQEALALAKKHGFGIAYPLIVAGAIVTPEAEYGVNCWQACG